MNCDQSKTTNKLAKDIEKAKNLISKIGARQPHFRDGETGKLHTIKVDADIHHQEYSGANNYHSDPVFNEYLAKVVFIRFGSLSIEAIALMQKDHDESLKKEEDFLLKRLAEIESLKEVAK